MNLDQALPTFIAESRELLDEMEAALLRFAGGDASIDDADDAGERVNAIFRAAHTIKGSAGLFGLDEVVDFTHVVESLLDRVRAGGLVLDPALADLLLACADHLVRLVDAVDAGRRPLAPDDAATGAGLLARLRARLEADAGTGGIDPPTSPGAATPNSAALETPAVAPAPDDTSAAEHWHVSLRFGADVLRNGMDPLAFIRYLATLGRIDRIVTVHDAVPALEALDPESCCLGFEIALAAVAGRPPLDKATIEAAFEFVIDDCTLHIVPPGSRIAEFIALIEALPEAPTRLGELLVRCGSVTERELDDALAAQRLGAPAADAALPLGRILTAQGSVAPQVLDAALAKQKQARDGQARDGQAPSETQSVRVDAGKLDRLIDLVGELIIAASSADLVARRLGNPELQECQSTLVGLVEALRDSALQLRMVKIGATFGRFKRVVHEVARELGKDIRLEVSGEDTELDKTVVEKIGDPLMHLVRNAIDHGIDPPALRAARGKPAFGTVALNAFHDSGSIVIEVRDDGGGLDRERILAKAIERGLVEPGRSLSDAEVHALIFEPGFSTAEQVTNLSGRGVGMDVVARNIAALRGSVQVASEPGYGTTVTVRLPLTLAIIDGFQVDVGGSTFVVPLDTVDECVEHRAAPDHDYADLRGEMLPFVRLRELFGLTGTPPARQNVVVVRHAGQRFGIVVDRLLGEAQTVIKPLSKLFAQARGISGSSILGSGEVALILDVPALLQLSLAQNAPAAATGRQTA